MHVNQDAKMNNFIGTRIQIFERVQDGKLCDTYTI